MKITFLGTGTSQGIPVIGCQCVACRSNNPRDSRLRSSVLFSDHNRNILIDVGPDFRQQMLKNEINRLDAILLTHEHNDHVIGLDDIRPFNFRQNLDMPIFGLARVLDNISQKFAYMFEHNPYPGVPRIVCHPIDYNERFMLFEDIAIQSIRIMHGKLPILGFRCRNFAYITDASCIGEAELELLEGLDVLVLNALQYRVHYSHYNFDEAIEMSTKINARMTYFTHMSHQLGCHDDITSKLPSNIFPAFDSLTLEI